MNYVHESVWTESHQKTIEDLKHRLCSTPILNLPDLQQPFEIETDASDYAVGVIFTQHEHPVAYHSETLSDAVWKYPTYDKEMYSIVQACQQWTHYILGKEIVIHTDHDPLQFMQMHGKLKMTVIRRGPHICNNSTSTLSTRRESPIGSSIASVDLQLQH